MCFYLTDNLSRCDYLQTYLPTSDFPSHAIGWLYPYDSILQPLFDKYLLELLQSGIFNKLSDSYHNVNHLDCPTEPYAKVEFSFIIVILIIFLIGVLLSLVILCLERNGVDLLGKNM